jgi:hypothetical protein
MRIRDRLRLVLLCTAVAAVHPACGSKGLEEDGETGSGGQGVPVPPSPSTLSLNLNVSDQGADMDAQQMVSAAEMLGANQLRAAGYVLVVNVNIAAQLLVPVALLRSAATATPVLTAEDTWTWSYQVTYSNRTWTSNLVGQKLSDTAYAWQMRVTSTPEDGNSCCSDFLFFDGQSSSAGSGSWQMYDPTKPGTGAKLFSVVYDYKGATDKTLVFTVNSDKSAAERFGKSSSVKYVISGDKITLEILDSSEGSKRVIAWNRVSRAGSHTDPQGNQVCWAGADENLADMDCQ